MIHPLRFRRHSGNAKSRSLSYPGFEWDTERLNDGTAFRIYRYMRSAFRGHFLHSEYVYL